MTEKIGIFGGSYNPVHLAHLIIASQFTEELKLDLCFFVPANLPPFKTDDNSLKTVSATDRLDMVKSAVADEKRFYVDDFEIKQGGISYTIDTIEYFSKKFPESKLHFLIGSDQIHDFHKWKDFQKILDRAVICIAARPDSHPKPDYDTLPDYFLKGKFKPHIINSLLIEISSSAIRERVHNGKSIRFLVTDSVEKYIADNGLYK